MGKFIVSKGNARKCAIACIIVALFSFVPLAISRADSEISNLYFSPASGTYHKGENFTVGVFVNAGTPINAVDVVFSFPTHNLEVLRVIKSDSLVNLWVQEPSYSNAGDRGAVEFGGIILNPGFTGAQGKIIDVVFSVKNDGLAELRFNQSALLANDGSGTNVTALHDSATFALTPNLSPPRVAPKTSPKEATTDTSSFSSTTHQTIIIKEIKEVQKPVDAITNAWNILPSWTKIILLAFSGVATLVFSLIVLSFGIIVLIYIWKHALSQREIVLKKCALLIKMGWHRTKIVAKKVLLWSTRAGKEVESDIEYALGEMEKDFSELSRVPLPSFAHMVKNYWSSLGRIIMRFFVWNTPVTPTNPDVVDSSLRMEPPHEKDHHTNPSRESARSCDDEKHFNR